MIFSRCWPIRNHCTFFPTVTEQIDLRNYSDYDMHLWDQEGDNFLKLLDNEQMLLGLLTSNFY